MDGAAWHHFPLSTEVATSIIRTTSIARQNKFEQPDELGPCIPVEPIFIISDFLVTPQVSRIAI